MKYLTLIIISLFCITSASFAMDKGHESHGHGDSHRIGERFHETQKDGYTLSYYLMDLREQTKSDAAAHGSHDSHDSHDSYGGHGQKEMDKPHHIMVYITDKKHHTVEKAKVGFLIKGGAKGTQKIMGMYMSQGFGITADMKEKGIYTITTKALIGDDTVMDSFAYEMK